MERNIQQNDAKLIDLGPVSVETKGSLGGTLDNQGLLQKNGLTND